MTRPLATLAAESAHRMTGVASSILLTGIGDQHLRRRRIFDFEGGDQRIFRVNNGGSQPVLGSSAASAKADCSFIRYPHC
jgi:hypothetical protein